jgi:hypothetical protein
MVRDHCAEYSARAWQLSIVNKTAVGIGLEQQLRPRRRTLPIPGIYFIEIRKPRPVCKLCVIKYFIRRVTLELFSVLLLVVL